MSCLKKIGFLLKYFFDCVIKINTCIIILNDIVPVEQNPETYTIIPGIQVGSQVYVDNLNFKYYKKSSHETVCKSIHLMDIMIRKLQLIITNTTNEIITFIFYVLKDI